MSAPTVPSRTVRLVNKLGLHARASAKLVALAGGFGARIRVHHGSVEADAKSIMKVMQLAAPFGAELSLHAEGDDAEAALDALVRLINDRFGEAE